MAKVSLRIYNREIEGLIDQGHIDEAIAHCHHILGTFPKHLETYRLLGKAHLEAKRYNEAVDIFSRVLMAVPEDFVAHVGMSIIRDEQNKFDDAIWHMERAFESQPSNAAIQGELQRLYGRRDGMDPPKIRMTRGALAFVYMQGELYPQAVAEILAVLAGDPSRGDMKVLLARAYFRSGQKADASDMCTQLLKQYPYCFDANRIMVELLPSTAGAAESTQIYRMRVIELDPYATFTKGSVFQSNEVADAAVNLERLEYTGNEVPMGQEWGSSLGIGLATASAAAVSSSFDEQPDWLKSGETSGDPLQAAPLTASASEPNDGIPDFLRAAGWGESNVPEQPTSFFDEPAGASDLVPADLPDWLKGQAPITEPAQSVQPQLAPSESIDTPDWLSGLGDEPSAESASAQANDVKDWLNGLDDAQEVKAVSAQSSDVPDWLGGLGDVKSSESISAEPANVPDWLSGLDDSKNSASTPAQFESDVPDWLDGLGGVKPSESTSAEPADVPDWLSGLDDSKNSASTPAQFESDVPDWLDGLGGVKPSESTPAEPATVPDWLSGLDDSKNSASTPAQSESDVPDWLSGLDEAKSSESTPAQASDLPDWLSGLDDLQAIEPVSSQSTVASSDQLVESLGSSAQEQDDAVAWLESLAAKHGAKPEELVTDPNKRSDIAPDWVQQAQNITQQPSEQPSVESLGSSAQEQDDAVAWLESLAAKHGAKPEELVTDPNKRSDIAPDWVQQAQAAGEANAQEEAAQANLQSEKSAPVEGALNIGEQFFAEFESSSTAVPATDETGMWLRNLDEKEKQDDFITPVADESKDIPEWMRDLESETKQSEAPEWLADAQSPLSESQEEEPVRQNSDLPNWLSGIEEESAAKDVISETGLPNQDLSDWLSGLDDEPGLPFEPIPTPNSILADAQPRPNTPIKQEPVPSNSELPDWLSDVDSNPQEDLEEDLWKKSIELESAATPASNLTDEPVSDILAVDLPEWLQGVQDESSQAVDADLEGEDAPPWLHREKWEAEEQPMLPKPTSPSDWHPVEAKETVAVSVQQEEQLPVEIQQPVSEIRKVEKPAPARKKPGLSARQPQPEAQNITIVLAQAKDELERGDIPTALSHYGKLIKKGKHLEDAIRDLSESLYRYPVEVGIWQTLGDAYMRSNRLKEALEAYNKAEELIR